MRGQVIHLIYQALFSWGKKNKAEKVSSVVIIGVQRVTMGKVGWHSALLIFRINMATVA